MEACFKQSSRNPNLQNTHFPGIHWCKWRNLKYIKLKINWADTPQSASKPFSTQVLAWLGLPETISKVGNTEHMAQKPARDQ